MNQDIERVLLSEEEIAAKVAEIGAKISEDYAGKDPIIISVLKGSFMFMADLVRAITIPCTVDFMSVSSYGSGTSSSGEVKIVKDFDNSIENRHVIIVEDIVETGTTMKRMIESLCTRNPASVEICTLLFKPERLKEELDIRYVAFEIPNDFIIGYGLDYDQQARGLRDIYVLKN